jgi:hypothetical protein
MKTDDDYDKERKEGGKWNREIEIMLVGFTSLEL